MYEKEIESLSRASEIREKHRGPADPRSLRALYALSCAQMKLKDYRGADRSLMENIRRREGTSTLTSAKGLEARSKLAELLVQTGRNTQAQALQRGAGVSLLHEQAAV